MNVDENLALLPLIVATVIVCVQNLAILPLIVATVILYVQNHQARRRHKQRRRQR